MVIPKRIKIIGKYYKIDIVESIDNDNTVWGTVKYSELKILIKKSLDYQNQCETLLHEVMHILFDVAGMSQNEKHIESISKVLYQVIPQVEGK